MTNDSLVGASVKIDGLDGPVVSTNQLGVAMSGLVAQWLRGLTINAHERLAIGHLWEHGPMTMSEMGARIPLSRAAVTALTDRLEALRYVQRTPDPHDRRRTVLTLTTRPQQLIREFHDEWIADVQHVEQQFSADELRAVERWNSSLRALAHTHASRLRARPDSDLPTAD